MELIEIGVFSRTHGLKGALMLRPDVQLQTQGLQAVFVEGRSGKAPYFVTSLSKITQGFLVTLESIGSLEQAAALKGKKVFADVKFVIDEETDDELVGFNLSDIRHGDIGTVFSVSDNGVQRLLHIKKGEKEIILPLTDDFVISVDRANRTILYNAPEGLVELYLGETGAGQ